MATKSIKSSGTQITQRGVNQGNVLVDPVTGLPISVLTDSSGKKRLAVDANITANIDNISVDTDYHDDSMAIGDPNTNTTLKINANGSIDANVEVDAADGDNIAISDGVNDLVINPDGSINVNVKYATTPTITNIPTLLANTQYSHAFPLNTKRFSIRSRGTAKLQMAFIAGQTNTNFITVYPGNKHEEKNIDLSSTTVYFQSSKAGEVVEILSWV